MTVKAEEEETKLHVAARLNNIELVRAALSEGFDPNTAGVHGWTPVHEAASSGNSTVTRTLLRSGGNPNIQTHLEKCTSLHLAARNGHLDVVKLLVRNGARLDLKNSEQRTAQEVAIDDCKDYLERKRECFLYDWDLVRSGCGGMLILNIARSQNRQKIFFFYSIIHSIRFV